MFTPLIDKEIKKIIKSKSDNLYRGMDYAVDGGKKLRSVMCLTACEVLGGDIKKALPLAAAIEIMHNATLVHDDIEDVDSIRRGSLTVWKKFGLAQGLNIGDGMIFKSYESLLNSSGLPSEKVLKLVEMLTNTLMEIVEGQHMELNFRERDDVETKEYEEMVYRKTGLLFGLSLAGGALIADASEKVQTNLIEYAKRTGLAFQLSDDILNLTADQGVYGKEIGGDIKEGKRTLIAIHCLENCDKLEKEKMLRILKKGRKNVDKKDVDLAISLIRKYRSIEFAKNYLEKMVKESKKYLDGIENSEFRKFLEEFLDFLINRKY